MPALRPAASLNPATVREVDLVMYLVISLFLIGVWAVTGFDYFWPGSVLAGWAVPPGLDAWGFSSRRPITQDDIEQELTHVRKT